MVSHTPAISVPSHVSRKSPSTTAPQHQNIQQSSTGLSMPRNAGVAPVAGRCGTRARISTVLTFDPLALRQPARMSFEASPPWNARKIFRSSQSGGPLWPRLAAVEEGRHAAPDQERLNTQADRGGDERTRHVQLRRQSGQRAGGGSVRPGRRGGGRRAGRAVAAVWPASQAAQPAKAEDRQALVRSGGAKRDRTADLLNAIQALSQLSYGPVRRSGI